VLHNLGKIVAEGLRERMECAYKLYVWSAISERILVEAFQFSLDVASLRAFSSGF
jgi:hypothetical protein